EGSSSDTVIIPQQGGVMIQDLPFTIKLKRFVIDYYRTGQPKLFASDVVLTDHQTGKTLAATIKVNEPLIYHGVAIYQSSFEDGGSKLRLTGYLMHGSRNSSFPLAGVVSESTPLTVADGRAYTIEWSGFRPFNVENMARPGQDLRAVNTSKGFGSGVADRIEMHMGSAADSAHPKELKNVGPSVQYKLRDKNGQAREYLNYMQPVNMDGNSVFLAGMRDSPSDEFRYLRIPADDEGSLQEWMRLRSALANPALRAEAARRYALRALPSQASRDGNMQQQLAQSAEKSLSIFAGAEKSAGTDTNKDAGYLAVSQFLEAIPVAEQEKAVDIFMKILNGSMWDLWQAARAQDGLPAVTEDEKHARFLQLATNALSDAFFYSAPVYLRLTGYDQVQASVLQLTRSPGKTVVYFGCMLLVLGVFSMFYIRERRLWVWIKPMNANTGTDGVAEPGDAEQTQALMAMSTQRETFDFEREFEVMKARLQQSA
ncbi:MAG: cytochrome c biogenesis protein ResB, partial [Herbaspirillum sp.]